MRRTTTAWQSALVALCVAGLVACGGGETGDAGQMGDEEAAGQAADTAGAMASDTAHEEHAGGAVDVALSPKNQSGIEGTARLHHHADTVHVTVRLTGLSSGESYPVHIHQGTCQEGGGVAVGLNAVDATDGSGSSETSFAAGDLSMDASHFVQAHLPDGTPAACGDVPGHGDSSASDTAGSGGGG